MNALSKFDMMVRAVKVFVPPSQLDSPKLTLFGAKQVMAATYPIVTGVAFKRISGFSDYCVGDDGTVWSPFLRRHPSLQDPNNGWKLIVGQISYQGYRYVMLARNGKYFRKKVGRIVLESFVGPCPTGMVCCHSPDPTRTNDRLSNLRWDTLLSNSGDMIIHGTRKTGSKVSGSKLKEVDIYEVRSLYKNGWTKTRIARRFGMAKSSIGNIISGKTWKYLP